MKFLSAILKSGEVLWTRMSVNGARPRSFPTTLGADQCGRTCTLPKKPPWRRRFARSSSRTTPAQRGARSPRGEKGGPGELAVVVAEKLQPQLGLEPPSALRWASQRPLGSVDRLRPVRHPIRPRLQCVAHLISLQRGSSVHFPRIEIRPPLRDRSHWPVWTSPSQ